MTLHVTAPTLTHLDALADLSAKTFGFGGRGYFKARDMCRDYYFQQCAYDWDASQIGFVDDTLVTHMGVWKYTMRIGQARVLSGGIGAVITHGDYRKRGYMDITANACIKAMRSCGYDVSVLFGIPDFYHKFRYIHGWASASYTVYRDVIPENPELILEPYDGLPRKDMMDLYNQENDRKTGTAVRPTFVGKYYSFGDYYGVSWKKDGVLAGYLLVDPRNTNAIEVQDYAGDMLDVMAAARALCYQRQRNDVVFRNLTENTPLAKWLKCHRVSVSAFYAHNGGEMIRIINLKTCIEKMISELSARVAHAKLADGSIRLSDGVDSVGLSWRSGQVRIDEAGKADLEWDAGMVLAQFIFGSYAPAELIERNQLSVSSELLTVLNALFPPQYPQIPEPDRF